MNFILSFFRKMTAIMFVASGLFMAVHPKMVVLMAVCMALCTFAFLLIGNPYAEDRKRKD